MRLQLKSFPLAPDHCKYEFALKESSGKLCWKRLIGTP